MSTGKNTAASVKQRLLNLAQARGEDFNALLILYGIERLLYRLSVSGYENRFILKGATLFRLWEGPPHRPTKDLDLLGVGAPDPVAIEVLFKAVCQAAVLDDGLLFETDSVHAEPRRENEEYPGLLVKLAALLGTARIPLQIDIGFGDATEPPPATVQYPVLLDFPVPIVRAYRRETIVAEKLEIMVTRGLANSRMKDYFDLFYLARNFAFDGTELTQAVSVTFQRRGTPFPERTPAGLSRDFAADSTGQARWRSFVQRAHLDLHPGFEEVIQAVQNFVWPPLHALEAGTHFDKQWPPGGPWIELGS